MAKNMDKTIEAADERAMAHMLYAGLNGVQASPASMDLSRQYWSQQFSLPWHNQDNPYTADYVDRFFSSLQDLTHSSNLLQRWREQFDDQLQPLPGIAKPFIADFMRAMLHYPRSYHDFSCYRQQVHAEHLMDFPIEHPLAVDYWTVYISNSGQGCLSNGKQNRELGQRSVLIMPPGHAGEVSRAANADSWHYDMLSFRSTPVWLELLDWAFSLEQPAILAIDEKQWPKLQASVEQLEQTGYQPGHPSERLCHNLIENILIHLRLAREQTTGAPDDIDPRLQAVMSYMLLHYNEPIELGEIARRVQLSPGQLNALFRKQFDTSVIRWRDGLRLQKAKELLVFTVLPVNEVAVQVGYEDPLYFSRRFKKQFGQSPRAWRQQSSE